jgi:hypothetical protein
MGGTNGLKETTLSVNVFTAPGKAMVGERPRPFGETLGFDPVTSTVIFGEYDAVLVDAMMTVAGAEGLADWVALHNRYLETIYNNARPFRPLLRFGHSARPFPGRSGDSNAQDAESHADVFHSHRGAVSPPALSWAEQRAPKTVCMSYHVGAKE